MNVGTGHRVTPSLNLCSDVFKNGFTCYTTLPNSHLYDCVLCATIADVNWDGRNELVLGTYGKVCMVTPPPPPSCCICVSG